MVLVPVHLSDEMDRTLMARVNEARDRYLLDRTPENQEAHNRELRQFADWVLRGREPEESAAPRPRRDFD
jgi:hypothetical protein